MLLPACLLAALPPSPRPPAGFSVVKLATNRETGEQLACKIMSLPAPGKQVCGGGWGGGKGMPGWAACACSVLCTFVLRLLLPKLYGGGWNLSAGASLLAPRAAFDHAMLAVRMAPPALLYLPKCTAHLCPC